jgi:Zn-dependent protease/predicted transcriptional regulator
MNGTIRVGNLFGIPFYVAQSWFLVLALVSWSYGSGLAAQFPSLSSPIPLLLGLVTALLLFASVLAHELGHSFVALRQGIGVKSITLFLFGGLASLEKESRTPAEAFWVAIAGPLVSLALFGIITTINATLPLATPITAILGVLAYVNLALALFNLIPGLPLDGGNILKALVWKITENPYKGVVFASRAGQFVGWIAIATGLIPLLVSGSFANFWNLLIGLFLLQNAGKSAQSAIVQDKFQGLTAADAITANSPIVSASMSLRDFADELIVNSSNWRKFLITDEQGLLIGAISVSDLNKFPKVYWQEKIVKDLMQPIDTTVLHSNQSLLEAVMQLEQQQKTALPVVQENGVLLGILEKAAVLNLLQQKTQANPA